MGRHLGSSHLGKMTKNRGTKTRFGKAQAIRQVGGKPEGKLNSTSLFRVGGGLFTEKEIVRARVRFGKSRGIK